MARRSMLESLRMPAALDGPIFHHSNDAIVVIDGNQTIVAANPAVEALFGWSADDLIGASLDRLLPLGLSRRHQQHVAHYMTNADGARTMGRRNHVYGRHRTGTVFPAEATIFAFTGSDAGHYGAIVRDLSNRVGCRHHTDENRRRFYALFDLTFQFIALLDPEGIVLEANQAALAFIARPADDVCGRFFTETAWFDGHPESRDRMLEAMRRAQRGEVIHGRLTHRRWDGEDRVFDFTVRPSYDAQGNLQYLIPEAHDITEIDRANKALERSEEHLRNAQSIARIGNWIWDIRTNDIQWSPGLYEILGLPQTGRLPSYDVYMACVHPDDRDALEHEVRCSVREGDTFSSDHRIIRPDGTERVLYHVAKVQRDDEGRALVMEGVAQDVTEVRANERTLIEARRQAEALSQAKSQFLSTISHELRTPLNAIIGFSEILTSELFGTLGDPCYREYAENIRLSGKHLLSIIETILDVSRVEQGRIVLCETETTPRALIASTLSLLGVTEVDDATAEGGSGCSATLAALPDARGEATPPLTVTLTGDALDANMVLDLRLARQMLLNLLSNSRKFSDPGTLIEVIAAYGDQGGVTLTVRDHGPGIPKAKLATVTEPFTQGDTRLARSHEGLGLGLYLVRTFAELHGGRLSLSLPEDGGTQATIWFPPDCLD
ncbi:hypothetical protein CKO24_07565 [Rhodothalassium salexigens DSM 2132]|nr:hypothetical protein [Rhodothalassium salexigens DSM 2132]